MLNSSFVAGARRGVIGLVACFAVAASLAGCGGSDEEEGGAAGEGAGPSQLSASEEKQERAKAAGEEMAAEEGEPVDLEPKTIGVLQIVGAAETIQRDTDGLEQAAEILGWKLNICDGEGDPAKMAACGNTLLNQKPDAIIGLNVEAAPVQAQMKRAQSDGIPWLNAGGPAAPSPLFSAQVVEDETEIGHIMAQFLIDKMGGEGTIATTEFPPILALEQRMAAFYELIDEQPGMETVDKHTVNFTDLTADVRRWSTATLTKHPDLGAFGLCVDTDPVAVASVVQSKFRGKQYPERPLIVGSQGDLANLDLIRKGQVDAVSETAISATAWMAIDQLAEHFARDKPFAENARESYPLDFLEAQLVTKENVPSEANVYVDPPEDFVAFFTAKWAKEFNAS
jgi:ABC-type sugar transport system substrate-binding protein